MTLGSYNVSPRSLEIDEKLGRFVTIVGIPSAFLLHGYVGFLFGSIKANPWWSTPLMPIVFLFSAIVSGIAAVLLLYIVYCFLNGIKRSVPCLDTMARYLFYAFLIDFSLEMLDLIHRNYEADESLKTLNFMVHTRLYGSQILLQIAREGIYVIASALTMCGIFAMRWNVVIGGQLFSKSFLGYTTYKMGFATKEGLLPALVLMALPFLILWVLVTLLPPMKPDEAVE
jgi:predicted membrane protein